MGYTICYDFQGHSRALEHPQDNLCGHDAVYYAMLHSGFGFDVVGSEWQGSYASMVTAAERVGVSNVQWFRSNAGSASLKNA